MSSWWLLLRVCLRCVSGHANESRTSICGAGHTPALVTVHNSNHSKGALDLSVAQSWWKVCCDLSAASWVVNVAVVTFQVQSCSKAIPVLYTCWWGSARWTWSIWVKAVDVDHVVLVLSLLERRTVWALEALRPFEENHYFICFNRSQIGWTLFSVFWSLRTSLITYC